MLDTIQVPRDTDVLFLPTEEQDLEQDHKKNILDRIVKNAIDARISFFKKYVELDKEVAEIRKRVIDIEVFNDPIIAEIKKADRLPIGISDEDFATILAFFDLEPDAALHVKHRVLQDIQEMVANLQHSESERYDDILDMKNALVPTLHNLRPCLKVGTYLQPIFLSSDDLSEYFEDQPEKQNTWIHIAIPIEVDSYGNVAVPDTLDFEFLFDVRITDAGEQDIDDPKRAFNHELVHFKKGYKPKPHLTEFTMNIGDSKNIRMDGMLGYGRKSSKDLNVRSPVGDAYFIEMLLDRGLRRTDTALMRQHGQNLKLSA